MAKVIKTLVKTVKGRSVARSVAAVLALGRAADYASRYCGGSPPELLDAVPAVVSAASGNSEKVRIAALKALEGFALDAGSDVVAAVTAQDYSSTSAPETIAAISALWACGPDLAAAGVGWLVELLEHAVADVVELTCRTLGWIGAAATDAIEPLIALAIGPRRLLRREAAGALIAIDPDGKTASKLVSDPVQRDALLMALREKGVEGREMVAKLGSAWAAQKSHAPNKVVLRALHNWLAAMSQRLFRKRKAERDAASGPRHEPTRKLPNT